MSESRRGFLAKVSGTLMAVTGAKTATSLIKPGEAEAYHFCGHIYTTDSCPHPTGLPRIDSKGRPLRAKDGHRVDDLGRLIDLNGDPVDEDGQRLTDADGVPLPAASRTPVCTAVAERYDFNTKVDGAWYRCCGGHVRKLVDCCSHSKKRINGDRSLTGYCYKGRKRLLRHVLPDEGAVLTCGPRHRRARRRRHRRVVAVRVLDGRDARARGLRRAAADDAGRVRDVHRSARSSAA